MPHGVIRKHGGPEVVGTWRAGPDFLTVETAHPDLRRQADRILTTPILIPQHPAQKFVQADETTAAFEPPARQRYLLLFMAEMEAAGYELEQLYDEDA
jgi:hypothetical protein